MSSKQDELLADFPPVSYEAWRQQVDKDLKGADFDKRLTTRTLEGLQIKPLYSRADRSPQAGPAQGGIASLRGDASLARSVADWDVRTEQRALDLRRAKSELAEDLAGGGRSLWLRFSVSVRLGAEIATDRRADGLPCTNQGDLDQLLADVDLTRTPIALDAGGNATALATLYLGSALRRGAPLSSLRGTLGCDPLAALARDGSLPCSLETAQNLACELAGHVGTEPSELRTFCVSTLPYHDAGASSTQELAYALATGLQYLRWQLDAGSPVARAAGQIEFCVGVASDLFVELAKLRALRLCWAKVVAAVGGDAAAQTTRLHAVTSARTKTARDPWVNMLRTTTEAFAALVGGADALTTRGFDEVVGASDSFARRIARNAQTILNEESHLTRVADAAGGSYYIETLTDQLARSAWTQFQALEARGGMSQALLSGSVAAEIAEIAQQRSAAIAKRSAPITGVSEFANVGEAPLERAASAATTESAAAIPSQDQPSLAQLTAAGTGQRITAAIAAAREGAPLAAIAQALHRASAPASMTALPVRRSAEPYEVLRERSDRHAAKTGQAPSAFLCNLGAIAQHKARASFASGFLQAGGMRVLDNDGFATSELASEAFAASGAAVAVICGSDEQYAELVETVAPLLRARGAREVVLAGRPGEREAAFQKAGVSVCIYLGVDVVNTLGQLFDRLGVAS